MAEAGAAPRVRLPWIDATRGYCVAAVVLFHVVLWHYAPEDDVVAPGAASLWSWMNSLLGSVRMPVLLAVSGLVMARRIRTAGPAGTLPRAAANYYLYVVWLLVYAVFYLVLQQPYLRHRVDGPLEVLVQLAVPATTLWYLFALAVYTVVLTAVRRVPPWVVLGALAVLSTVMHAQTFPGQLWYKVPELFVFYAVGVYGADVVRRLAEGASVARVLVAGVAAAAVTGVGRFTEDSPALDALLFVPRGLAFMTLMVLVVALASRWSPVRRLGVALGRQTLAVYVLHPLWIALLAIATVAAPGLFAALLGNPAVAIAYPAAVTAAIIALSLPARPLAERLRAGWLFAMPERWTARLAGESSDRTRADAASRSPEPPVTASTPAPTPPAGTA